MSVVRGTSFQWDEGSGVQHTWVVATHEWDEKHVLICLSSVGHKSFIDETCIIDNRKANYHRITEKSFAFYRQAKVKTVQEILDLIADPINTANQSMPCWLVDTIASGLMKSRFASVRARNQYLVTYA